MTKYEYMGKLETPTSAYVTFDTLDINNGAGLVCMHEISALEQATSLQQVISRPDIKGLNNYEFNPFLADYFAAQVFTGQKIDILHLSCSPGLYLLERIKPKHFTINIVAHDLEESIKEHERFYGKGSYNYKHNTDPYLHELLLKHATRANLIFTPSSVSAKWIDANIKMADSPSWQRPPVCIIPHGTEIPYSFEGYPEKFTVGYLGAYGPDKGIGYLTQAWNKNPQGELLLGGTCCKALEQSYHLLPKEFPNTRLLGWVNQVYEFYNQLSIYVQPSVTEGFGIEILEAMAHGRPVIASRGAGGADVIHEGIDGFVVPPRDVDALAQRINFFIDHPAAIAIMGEQAHHTAREYSWDKIEKRYVDAYTSLGG
jgi:glycosyltransferase involved in cell wall biosynthesis